MRPVALITGGSRNIGWSIAQCFAATHRIVVGDLAPPPAPLPEGIAWFECDVRDYGACERMAAFAAASGPLAVLIHSAAITKPPLPFGEISPAEWTEVIDVNLTGTFHVARASLESLKAARGSAVLISSRAARVGYAALNASASGTKPHYCAAKAGVISLTRSLAAELAPHGVRINCVAPGSIEGEMIPRHRWPEIAARVPLGRLGRPEEIAEACFYLCSPAASYITGHVLDVNGGTWMN